jgi:23S rRNA (pseudouridine1915-N3)-methyltransferase
VVKQRLFFHGESSPTSSQNCHLDRNVAEGRDLRSLFIPTEAVSSHHKGEFLNLTLAFVAQRSRSDLLGSATDSYLDRIAPYAGIEAKAFRDEEALFAFVTRQRSRTPAWLVLLDRRGEAWSSEELARWLRVRRDSGQQMIVFGIGPPSGWSEHAPQLAQTKLSLGPMTLPHELARLVIAEQLYRAFTILAGHPYHTGH